MWTGTKTTGKLVSIIYNNSYRFACFNIFFWACLAWKSLLKTRAIHQIFSWKIWCKKFLTFKTVQRYEIWILKLRYHYYLFLHELELNICLGCMAAIYLKILWLKRKNNVLKLRDKLDVNPNKMLIKPNRILSYLFE